MTQPEEHKAPETKPSTERLPPRPIAKTQPEPEALDDFELWNIAFDEAESCSR